jgi:uncharacterized protein (TIGR00290 family)
MAEPILFSWSGGKDSARALQEIAADDRLRVVSLLTTMSRDFQRVSMHGVRRALHEEQARALGLPLQWIEIPAPCSNAEYEYAMRDALAPWIERGVRAVAFGDIFLEDLRRYREEKLALAGLRGIYPLWKRDTRRLADEFVERGYRAVVTCIDPKVLDPSFAGREIDATFLADLPPSVDPCGENGEFHSFVFDGPGLARPVAYDLGERVLRDGFWYCDLVPRASHPAAAVR